MKIKNIVDVDRLRCLFSYDPKTGVLSRITGRSAGLEAGTLFSTGHKQVSVDGVVTGVHRIAWALHHGAFPAEEVDHINGDGADNRIRNLRLATSAQNNANRRLGTRNKSGVKGVFRHRNGWRVAICANGKYHITHFKDFDAAKSYAAALRIKLHGAFANDGFRPVAEGL